jgi:hypothetical protein
VTKTSNTEAVSARALVLERGKSGIRVWSGPWGDQKLIVPSPLRPQTTMAIEKLNNAAREAQPRVMSMGSPKQQ